MGKWLGCDRGITHTMLASPIKFTEWVCGRPSIVWNGLVFYAEEEMVGFESLEILV